MGNRSVQLKLDGKFFAQISGENISPGGHLQVDMWPQGAPDGRSKD